MEIVLDNVHASAATMIKIMVIFLIEGPAVIYAKLVQAPIHIVLAVLTLMRR